MENIEVYEETVWTWFCINCDQFNQERVNPLESDEIRCDACGETYKAVM